ncbi:MAG: hypothetical protein ABFD76_04970 [Smithella sp.]
MDKIKSAFGKINYKDIRRALGLGISAALTYFFSMMAFGMTPNIDTLQSTGMVFLGSAGTYLTKNWLTNSADEFLKPEKDITNQC